MNKVAYHNSTGKYVHIGAVTIPPGGTREVDPRDLPDYQPQAAEPEQTVDVIGDILSDSIKDITANMADYTDAALEQLEQRESAAKQPRKTLLEALAGERLRRASESQLQQFEAEVRAITSEEELLTLTEQFGDDPERMAMIESQLKVLSEQD